MLNFFRKNTKMIVWVVVIAFVAWGGYAVSVQFEASNRAPGRIFGKEVSYRDYLSTYRSSQIFSPSSKDNPPTSEQTEAQTWQFLILSHEAKRRKISVTNEEVREQITHFFGGEGGTGLPREQYFRWVQSVFQGQPREFENQVRERLRVQKLLAEVKGGFPADQREEGFKQWMLKLLQEAKIEVYKAPTP